MSDNQDPDNPEAKNEVAEPLVETTDEVQTHIGISSGSDGNQVKSDKQKIDILLKATGNAPIMKKKKWAVDPEKKIGWIIEFIKKYLKIEHSENLFLYVNQAFAPAPDQIVKNLYDCFGTDGKLILHYCKSQAWG